MSSDNSKFSQSVGCNFKADNNKVFAGIDVPVKYSGRLTVIHKEERRGRNPKTGEKVHIKRKAYVHFKLGKDFIIV